MEKVEQMFEESKVGYWEEKGWGRSRRKSQAGRGRACRLGKRGGVGENKAEGSLLTHMSLQVKV